MLETVFFGLEVIRLSILYYVLYKKVITNRWVPLLTGVMYFVVFVLLFPDFNRSGKLVLAVIISTFIMLFLTVGSFREKRRATLVLFLVALVLEQCCSVPVKIANIYLNLEERIGSIARIIVNLIGIGVLLCILIWNKNKTKKEIEIISNRKLYVLVIVMVIQMFITSGALGFTQHYVPNIYYKIFTIIMVCISYLSIGTLGLFVVHIRKVYADKEEMLNNEIVLKEMQKSYYETLLQKEEETRQYRHDMSGHLLCLNDFAQKGNLEALIDYLQKIEKQMIQIQHKNFVTGNQVLDVITNHYTADLKDSVRITVIGQWKNIDTVDNVTLCIIYSNLLKNAVEELDRVKEDKKILQIEFLQGEDYSGITISNTMAAMSKEKTSLFSTEKADRKMHGHGLQNVKRAVKECGGQLRFSYDDNLFTANFSVMK